ncbi:MAG: acetyl-CoA carboxylase biotin carboxyl carrier protein subunit [Chloroflexi bacterium]|nr:acetyl-CoA carboxylase biotin carboxyl carrier protein subunit [Chloroflexota bacterium]
MAALSDRMPDPRGVRIALSAPIEGLGPLVLEPPQLPLVAVPRMAGEGLLGGTAPVEPAGLEEPAGDGSAQVLVDGEPIAAELSFLDGERAILRGEGHDEATRVLLLPPPAAPGLRQGISHREVIVDGWRIEVEVESAARAALRERASRGREEATHSGPTEVHAIIPGVVVAVSVAAGDAVVAGQQLLVVEAMKMQNELRAPRDGTVERIAVGPGVTIEVGDLLLVLS